VHPFGVAALERWGLVDRLAATGCPAIHTYAFDFGPFTLSGAPGTSEAPVAYCPRRTVLDKLLVDAAAEAGADVREGVTVDEVLFDDGRVVGVRCHSKDGRATEERGRVVIGADGRHSAIAKAVRPDQYHEKPPPCRHYSYWSGLFDGRSRLFIRPNREPQRRKHDA
jgi:2-polyprenyl-6-methoxyphenol hydroxylase-like FAD-dependent oxidoreductase